MKMLLRFGDIAVIAGLLMGAVGINQTLFNARIETEYTKLSGETALGFGNASSDRARIEQKLSRSNDQVLTAVISGLDRRTDEVLLSLLTMTNGLDVVKVSLSNMATDGIVYPQFVDFAEVWGSDANIIVVGQVAHGWVRVPDLSDDKILRLNSMLAAASSSEYDAIQVSMRAETAEIDPNSELYEIYMQESLSKVMKHYGGVIPEIKN